MSGPANGHFESKDEQVLNALRRAGDRIRELEELRREPIAVVGIGCRLPGGVENADDYWNLLIEGTDAIREVPADRWSAQGLHAADSEIPGKITSKEGGFIDGVELFDPLFFGISPREAVAMDPQQRMALEVAWEALEDAGTDWKRLKGRPVGVFFGATNSDYARVLIESAGKSGIDAHFATGNALNSIAGRISYVLGLRGPSLTVDTACSSSLVAVHLACQSLRFEECDAAVAGGVNLILRPEASIATSRARMLAPDGRCKTFDSSADGYVRSEGCGAVVLMRLSTALREGARIFALIKGSAVNQNGDSSGFTVPSTRAQEALIRAALKNAGLAPDDVYFVEAHGTGTALGDPIELHALDQVYGTPGRARSLMIGSVKSNIGHAESAAGIAGLIKAILASSRRLLPPNLHIDNPTSKFPWAARRLKICTAVEEWPQSEGRCAAVSSFGASGTNAHIIIERIDSTLVASQTETGTRENCILALSARTREALVRFAARAGDWLETSDAPFRDICRTVNLRRPQAWRLVVHASTGTDAALALRDFCAGKPNANVTVGSPVSGARTRLRAVFSGPADDRLAANVDRYAAVAAFRSSLEQLGNRLNLAPDAAWRTAAGGRRTAGNPIDTLSAFAMQIALVDMWERWGIVPDELAASGTGFFPALFQARALDLDAVVARFSGRPYALARHPTRPVFSLHTGEDWTSRLINAAALEEAIRSTGNAETAPACVTEILTIDPCVATADEVASKAFLAGLEVDWANFFPGFVQGPVSFPRSPYERGRYWPSPETSPDSSTPRSAILDRLIDVPSVGVTVAESDVLLGTRPAYDDHLVFGTPVVAGAVHLALMMEATARRWGERVNQISALRFERALVPSEYETRAIQVTLRTSTSDSGDLRSESFVADGNQADRILHASAKAEAGELDSSSGEELVASARNRCPVVATADTFYSSLAARSQIEHRQHFRWIETVAVGSEIAVGDLVAPDEFSARNAFSPGLIDCCFQLLAAACGLEGHGTFVPVGLASLNFMAHLLNGRLTGVAQVTKLDRFSLAGRIDVFNENHAAVASFREVEFRRASAEALSPGLDTGRVQTFALDWRSCSRADETLHAPRRTIIAARDVAFGKSLHLHLTRAGPDPVELLPLVHSGSDGVGLDSEALSRFERAIAEAENVGENVQVLYLAFGTTNDPAPLHPEAGLLQISHALLDRKTEVKLTTVTREALWIAKSSEMCDFFQSGLWGFSRVLLNEHPELHVRALDIDRRTKPADLAKHLAKLKSGDHVAERNGELLEPQITPALAVDAEFRVLPDRLYVLTGGFGALGNLIAHYLVEQGARYLALLSRSGLDADKHALIRALEEKGAEVVPVAVDIADRQALRDSLAALRKIRPLGGVVHAAGVLDDASARDISWDRMKRVLAPKVVGAWFLHLETLTDDLDMFILFSSASALFGTPGQIAYAAGNAGLDGIAGYRHGLGLPATSLAWGPWAAAGMAARLSERQVRLMASLGLDLIDAEEGLRAFHLACAAPWPQQVILRTTGQSTRFRFVGGTIRNLLGNLVGSPTHDVDSGVSAHREAAAVLRADERVRYVTSCLRIGFAEILKIPAEELGANDVLATFGMDSLMGMELSAWIRTSFKVELPLTALLDASLNSVAFQISREIDAAGEPGDSTIEAADLFDSSSLGALITGLEDLSEGDLDILLTRLKPAAQR